MAAGKEDEVVFGEGEARRGPCVRFVDAASIIRVGGDHGMVGGFCFAVCAKEGTNDAVEHLGVASWGFALLGGEVDVEARFVEDLAGDCRF